LQCESARLRSSRTESCPSRRPPAARAATEGESSRRFGALCPRIPAGGSRHDARGTGTFSRGDVAASSFDLQLHLGNALRGQAESTSHPCRADGVWSKSIRRSRTLLRSGETRGQSERVYRGGGTRRRNREKACGGGEDMDRSAG